MRKVLGMLLSVALAVTMMPAAGLLGSPAFAGEDPLAEEDAFAFEEDSAVLHALEADVKSYPDWFDLRHVNTGKPGEEDVSFVTPVKVQNPYGTCWGFAAASAAESSLIASGLADQSIDLSEKHIAWFATSYIDDPNDAQYNEGMHFRNVSKKEQASSAYRYNTGGVNVMATALFASGMGPLIEDGSYPLAYKGARGERTLRNVATRYDVTTGKPDPDSYKKLPVWYSDQDDWSIPDEYRYGQNYKLKNSFIMPDPANYTQQGQDPKPAIDAIKQQMYEHHRAVSVSFCAESYLPGQDTSDKKYMSKYWAHYTSEPEASNHMVTIVGWDDHYPKENFLTPPPGDGAFLMKNSWGSELNEFPNNGYRHWGLLQGQDGVPYDKDAEPTSDRATGYFWMSYYDLSMNDPEAFEFEECTGDYDIGQTDLMSPMNYFNVEENGIVMANVLEAAATSSLDEIMVMTTTPGTHLSYQVYLLGDSFDNPEDGILIAEGEEDFELGGHQRIALKTPRVLAKEQKYSVVIRASSEFGDYICCPYNFSDETNMYSVGVINKGESWIYYGKKWADLSAQSTQKDLTGDFYSMLALDNFSIKAYLDPVTYPEGEDNPVFDGYLSINNWQEGNPGTFSLEIGQSKALAAEFRGISKDMPDSWNPEISWKSLDENVVTVTTKDPDNGSANITGVAPGKTQLMVDAGDYGVRVLSIIVQKPEAADNTLKVSGKKAVVKYSKVSKRAQKLNVSKVIKFTDKGEGTLTYKKVKGNKKITVNTNSGKVTIKKGLKKGKYVVRIQVNAAGDTDFKPASQTVKATIRVK